MASGKTIPNLGERICEVYAGGLDNPPLMNFQVADIHKPLLTLSKAADMGFHSHLYKGGGWLEDEVTGQIVPIHRRGNLYVMQMWVGGVPGTNKPLSRVSPGKVHAFPEEISYSYKPESA